MSLAPSAQFRPTAKGFACATLTQKASLVCPLSVRPLMSTIVPDTCAGCGVGFPAKFWSRFGSSCKLRPEC